MMSTDLENLREKLENEAMRKSDALKAVSKAQAEIQLWKSRYETEGLGRIEELEGARSKLQAKIVENEELVDVLSTKVANAEKSKSRLGSDLDDISMEYERVHAAALITEKRAKNFDKVLGEWLSKASDVQAEVAASQDEGRNYSSELFRLKAAQDEATEQLDIVKRENKNLADEIKDLLDQLGEGGRSIHDLDKQRPRLETEKEELQAALEEAEATLEMEENKVLRAQLELAQVKQEIDRRVAEKEDEFNNTRKTMPVLWILLEPQLKLSNVQRVRLSVSRSNLKEKLMSLKLDLIMLTRPTQRALNLSNAIRVSSMKQSNHMKMKLVPVHRLLSRLESQSVRLLLFLEKLRKAKPFLMVLIVPSVKSKEILLMPELLSTICRQSTVVT